MEEEESDVLSSTEYESDSSDPEPPAKRSRLV